MYVQRHGPNEKRKMNPPLLSTDGYKFSMAEAGAPLRRETFYYTHRKGGRQLLPFDVEAEVKRLLPVGSDEDYAYLAAHEYEMGAAFKQAIASTSALQIDGVPKGAWFFPRESVFSLSGPSAVVSWLEPLLLQLNFRIQVATLAATDRSLLDRALTTVTCEEQRSLVIETLDAVGVSAPAMTVDSDGYYARVKAQATELVEIVGDGARLFEVGLRSATCLKQHRIALQACQAAGVTRTSHVQFAQELGLTPVGTMGHEHVQRYGSDVLAFRAMRDSRRSRSSRRCNESSAGAADSSAAGVLGFSAHRRRGDGRISSRRNARRENDGRGEPVRAESGRSNMADLFYVTGDATVPADSGPRIIAHICNDVGGWGRGFVLALSKRWPEPEAAYRDWFKTGDDFDLGKIRLVGIAPALWVANMIAQEGLHATAAGPPIRYDALERCLGELALASTRLSATVHMPRIGAGLAGGDWKQIERLIRDQLVDHGVSVTVYDLPPRGPVPT